MSQQIIDLITKLEGGNYHLQQKLRDELTSMQIEFLRCARGWFPSEAQVLKSVTKKRFKLRYRQKLEIYMEKSKKSF